MFIYKALLMSYITHDNRVLDHDDYICQQNQVNAHLSFELKHAKHFKSTKINTMTV